MKDSPKIQGAFKGVNRLCRRCTKECKQFENVKIVQCGFDNVSKKV